MNDIETFVTPAPRWSAIKARLEALLRESEQHEREDPDPEKAEVLPPHSPDTGDECAVAQLQAEVRARYQALLRESEQHEREDPNSENLKAKFSTFNKMIDRSSLGTAANRNLRRYADPARAWHISVLAHAMEGWDPNLTVDLREWRNQIAHDTCVKYTSRKRLQDLNIVLLSYLAEHDAADYTDAAEPSAEHDESERPCSSSASESDPTTEP